MQLQHPWLTGPKSPLVYLELISLLEKEMQSGEVNSLDLV